MSCATVISTVSGVITTRKLAGIMGTLKRAASSAAFDVFEKCRRMTHALSANILQVNFRQAACICKDLLVLNSLLSRSRVLFRFRLSTSEVSNSHSMDSESSK